MMNKVFLIFIIILTVLKVEAKTPASELIRNVDWSLLSKTVSRSVSSVPTEKYWKITLFDDFKGKPATPSARDNYCYDGIKPQCHIWPGSSSFDCDLSTQNNLWQPTVANMRAAVKSVNPNLNTEVMSDAQVKAQYSQTVASNWQHLNKCTWTGYTMVNWMATDYQGKWSARMDPTQVKVNPAGKGYLELSARKAPITDHCVFGGTYTAVGPLKICRLNQIDAIQFNSGVSYWVDSNTLWPGIFYKKVNGTCPYGGFGPVNCQVYSFPKGELQPGVGYGISVNSNGTGTVYYNDSIKYACKDNIEYPNGGVFFQHLSCPLLNGAIMSSHFQNLNDSRGFEQKYGRFETKITIPEGRGAFPAAWLLPKKGGWPFEGGEIDIMEARDDANEVYQTYHHGKCVQNSSMQEIVYSPNHPENFVENNECRNLGGATSVYLHKGYTKKEIKADEYHTRDHVFAAEWDQSEIRFYVNDQLTHTIKAGVVADPSIEGGQSMSVNSLSQALKTFSFNNLPTSPFYWILNHSTYVADANLSGWQSQKVLFDYVKTYQECRTDADFCPSGGVFVADKGCSTRGGAFYQSPCKTLKKGCPLGGEPAGPNCQMKSFYPAEFTKPTSDTYVVPGVNYWVDTNPAWKGIFYHKVNGGCPYGGSGTVNCMLAAVPSLNVGTAYWVDTNPKWAGVFYKKINNACPYGGSGPVNCQLLSLKIPARYLNPQVNYWVDTNQAYPGIYYQKINGLCPYGGSGTVNCQLEGYPADFFDNGVNYWVDKTPAWPGIYYAPDL